MLQPRQIGRYVLLDELGRGGIGRLMRAEDPAIRRQVAIRLIPLHTGIPGAGEQLREESFLREIQSAGALQHPNIISIFDAGRQDDLAYVVMELVDGVTLETMLHAKPRPQAGALLAICRQVASALDYAHANGIVHRDIKPGNILVDSSGTARIGDFGIANLAAGPVDYKAPEQIAGHSVDGTTDQWSLAAMAYTALTGRRPWAAGLLPAAADAVMRKALSSDPGLRYGSCSEFMDALAAVLPAEAPAAPAATPPPKPARGNTVVAAALGVILAMVATIVFLLTGEHKAATAPSSTPRPLAAVPAGIGKPSPGVSAARKAQISAAAPELAQTAPAAEPRTSTGGGDTYQVRLVTSPPDADVTVDGRREAACKSPCTADLAAGVHTLIARKEGYRAALQNFQVSGEEEEVAVTLNPITGSLLLETQPPGAGIAVDGTARTEVTPVTLALPVGKYRVRLTRDGFAPFEFEAVVLPESMREVSVKLGKSAH